jgi:hypothetical protein
MRIASPENPDFSSFLMGGITKRMRSRMKIARGIYTGTFTLKYNVMTAPIE